MPDYPEGFEEQQDALINEPFGFNLPEWCSWFLPLVFLACFGVGAVVITKWVIEALLWIVRYG